MMNTMVVMLERVESEDKSVIRLIPRSGNLGIWP